MKLLTTIAEMRAEVRANQLRDASIGFVPTMGTLHEGHLSLMRRAREENEVSVASIFVNPAQFTDAEDFKRYPRDLERDLKQAESVDVDVVFAPADGEMHDPERQTAVVMQGLTDRLCGITRGQGHFFGVCTVVAKLFNIVQPARAYFGQKDAQQAVVIQRMVSDLHFPVDIVVCPVVRAPDGLALASRNLRLQPEERDHALSLRRALEKGRESIRAGERNARELMSAMALSVLEHDGVELDYLDIVDPETLKDVEAVAGVVLMAGAIKVGRVRLIDNILVGPDGPWED